MGLLSDSDIEARFSRQRGAISDETRQNTLIVSLGGTGSPFGCGLVQLGALLTGCGGVISDFDGVAMLDRGETPFAGPHEMFWSHGCREQTEFLPLRRRNLHFDEVGDFIDSFPRQRICIACDRPGRAIADLEILAHIAPLAETVLYLTNDDGFAVQRCATPRDAIDSLKTLTVGDRDHMAADCDSNEPIDLSMVAAGTVLGLALFTERLPSLDQCRTTEILVYKRTLESRKAVTPQWSQAWELLLPSDDSDQPDRFSPAGRNVTVVGVGAIGSFAAMGLAMERLVASETDGVVDLLDGDAQIEPSNLARQPLYTSEDLGRAKVEAAALALRRIDPRGEYRPTTRFVAAAADVPTDRVDMILCCPDNDQARLVCARAAVEAGVPLAVGATRPFGGSVWVQSAGRDDYLRYIEKIDPRHRADRNSCAEQHAGATVVPNMIVGGLMLAEIKTELARAEPRNMRYDGTADTPRMLRATAF